MMQVPSGASGRLMPTDATLARTLTFRDLTLLVVGAVIGSGVFLVPGAILRDVNGTVALSLAVWVGGGLLSLLGALTYGELAAMQPEAGGLYVFIRDGFGRLPAFLYGWTLFLVIATGSVATLAVAFSAYLGQIVQLSPIGVKAASVAMIAVITAVNVRGARQSSDLQNWTTLIKVAAIVVMTGVLFALGRNFHTISDALWPTGSGSLASGFGVAMIAVLWA